MEKSDIIEKSIYTLVNDAKNGCESSLLKLNEIFHPILNCLQSKYTLNYYDDDDWNQEALIIMYNVIQNYNLDIPIKAFATYYKIAITNHIITLFRYQNAKKRKTDFNNYSVDQLSQARIPNSIIKQFTYIENNLSFVDYKQTILVTALGKMNHFQLSVLRGMWLERSQKEQAIELNCKLQDIRKARRQIVKIMHRATLEK